MQVPIIVSDNDRPRRSPARSTYRWLVALCIAVCLGTAPGQQANAPAVPASTTPLPAEVQAKIDGLQGDLRQAEAKGDAGSEAKTLVLIGDAYFGVSRLQIALEYFNEALPIFRRVGDGVGEATALDNVGLVYSHLGEMKKALDCYSKALPALRQAGDRAGEANTLNDIAGIYDNLGEKQTALGYLNQALQVSRVLGDRSGEAMALNNLASVYKELGGMQKALDYLNQALPMERQKGDRAGEATTLNNLGIVYSALGDWQKALDYYNQALPILRQVGDRIVEATTLNNIAAVYDNRGDKQKALNYYNQALQILIAVGDRRAEATMLNNIGRVYDGLGEKQKALDYYSQALPVFRQVGNRVGEATILHNTAGVYHELGERQKALDYYNQALLIRQAVNDPAGEATTLNNIGALYRESGDTQKALELYNQSLLFRRQVDDRAGEARTLNGIGGIYSNMRDNQKALDFYDQALLMDEQVGDPAGEATTLNNIGTVYVAMGKSPNALHDFDQALPLATEIGDALLETVILGNLFIAERSDEPTLAIFFGKQAVNLLQQVRGNIQGLGTELQKSFVASKYDYYRDLADLLIAQGRLPEAEQVLDLLKQQEYTDFIRGDPGKSLGPLSLTPAEQQAERDYQTSTAKLLADSELWNQLKENKARTPEEDRKFQQLTQELSNARESLQAFYLRLHKLFAATGGPDQSLAAVTGDVSFLKGQIASTSHAVGLRTVLTGTTYSVIVVTGSTPVARQYSISRDKLNQKIAAFQQVLRDPAQDPKPLAQELYKILIGPVQADLDQVQAQTLIWTLDDTLRYIPMAALYDGKHYMVEKYNMVSITLANYGNLREPPNMDRISALAMGISRKYQDDLNPLPTVVGELDDIVKDPAIPGAGGVLPGTILLNNQFTEKAMEDQLDAKHAIVHIASHFVLNPGDAESSYLLLAGKETAGAGYHLTLADFRDNPNLKLDNTELLTLSACDTGVGGTADGLEVDGLASTALGNGAQAVISSLWQVNDASTGNLMADFYKQWVNGGGKTMKVEALRQAQLDLLEGKIKPAPDYADPNAPSSFAHPYYWAPFVLTGNWK